MTYTAVEQANIQTITNLFAAENRSDWDAVYRPFKPDCIGHAGATLQTSLAEMRESDPKIFALFASHQRTLLAVVAQGDLIGARWRADVTTAGSGKPASWEGSSWWRFEGAEVAECWAYFDSADVQRQMRPPKEEAK